MRLTDVVTKGELHTFVNLYSYSVLRHHKDLTQSIDNILIDGQLMVSVLSVLGAASLQRKSFDMTSLAKEVFSSAIKTGESVFLVGTKPSVIGTAVENIATRFPGLNVCGFHHGYLDKHEDSSRVIEEIVSKAPNIVVVGMGTPRQEQFLVNLRSAGWNGTGYTCGGFFHQTATNIDYYPTWADKLNLRWLYRIYDEPKLVKRYFIQYPLALCLITFDFKIKPLFSR